MPVDARRALYEAAFGLLTRFKRKDKVEDGTSDDMLDAKLLTR
ncbi:hypothetical protein [Bradyrhizobium cenepequi]|nr:hypothetical protein [Bradyrhizobium cenepequi]